MRFCSFLSFGSAYFCGIFWFLGHRDQDETFGIPSWVFLTEIFEVLGGFWSDFLIIFLTFGAWFFLFLIRFFCFGFFWFGLVFLGVLRLVFLLLFGAWFFLFPLFFWFLIWSLIFPRIFQVLWEHQETRKAFRRATPRKGFQSFGKFWEFLWTLNTEGSHWGGIWD